MKKIKLIQCLILLSFIFAGCSKDGINDDTSFVNTSTSNAASFAQITNITNDNSGNVTISPVGEGMSYFTIRWGTGTDSTTVLAGYNATHSFPEGSYTVTVIAYDIAGKVVTSNDYPITLIYRVPENLAVTIGSDAQISATALYANYFLVYFGDVANEVPTRLEVGGTLPPHNYPTTGGPFELTVVAESGGAASVQSVTTLFGLPVDFESSAVNYFFGTFGNAVFSKVPNPFPAGLNTSATVGKYEKTIGANNWSGTYSPLNIPINFSQGKIITMLVYNPSPAMIGDSVNVELEAAVGGTPANGVAVLKRPFTTSGAWEELVFDYSGLSAIPANSKFGQLVLRFDDSVDGTGETFYIDNIRQTN